MVSPHPHGGLSCLGPHARALQRLLQFPVVRVARRFRVRNPKPSSSRSRVWRVGVRPNEHVFHACCTGNTRHAAWHAQHTETGVAPPPACAPAQPVELLLLWRLRHGAPVGQGARRAAAQARELEAAERRAVAAVRGGAAGTAGRGGLRDGQDASQVGRHSCGGVAERAVGRHLLQAQCHWNQ
jgi:hypothetical protein